MISSSLQVIVIIEFNGMNKKARIVYVKKEIGIEFRLPFERTWSAISRAIEKTGYEVSDRNRELKYIQIKVLINRIVYNIWF